MNPSTGVYTFNSSDAASGTQVTVTYSFFRWREIAEELNVVPLSSPYRITVQNASNFSQDNGVVLDPSNVALVAGTDYTVSAGVYTFIASRAGAGVVLSYTWKNPNTDANAPNQLNLTFLNGAQGQSPTSFMTSMHTSQAWGYSNLAYWQAANLYLGFSNQFPNYSFEVQGDQVFGAGIMDANPADCILNILTDQFKGVFAETNYNINQYIDPVTLGTGLSPSPISVNYNARNYWTANNFFISPAITSQQPVATILSSWLEAGACWVTFDGGLIKFIPYGGSTAVANGATYSPNTQPVFTFFDQHYMEGDAQDPIKVTSTDIEDITTRYYVGWNVRANAYNRDSVYAEDPALQNLWGSRQSETRSYDFICTQAAASFAASMGLQRSTYIRNSYAFRVQSRFMFLSPGDIVEINDSFLGLVNKPVRINKLNHIRRSSGTRNRSRGLHLGGHKSADYPHARYFAHGDKSAIAARPRQYFSSHIGRATSIPE